MAQIFILKEKLKAKSGFKNPLSFGKTGFSFVPWETAES